MVNSMSKYTPKEPVKYNSPVESMLKQWTKQLNEAKEGSEIFPEVSNTELVDILMRLDRKQGGQHE